MTGRKRVVLHGYLKSLYDGPAEFVVESAAEAIEAFSKQTKAFDVKLGKPRHQIVAVGFDTADALFVPTDAEEIHLIPSYNVGKSALVQILVGAALVAISFAVPGSWAVAGIAAQSLIFGVGSSLLLGGVLQLLSPAPQRDTPSGDPEASKYLGVPRNTVAIGTRIPVAYGQFKLYGHFLSFQIDAKDVALQG